MDNFFLECCRFKVLELAALSVETRTRTAACFSRLIKSNVIPCCKNRWKFMSLPTPLRKTCEKLVLDFAYIFLRTVSISADFLCPGKACIEDIVSH